MYDLDQEKTTFITPLTPQHFCNKVMPFEQKNARITYQRMITKMFMHLMNKTMDAYIDDKVVKSKNELDHLKGLAEVFEILK